MHTLRIIIMLKITNKVGEGYFGARKINETDSKLRYNLPKSLRQKRLMTCLLLHLLLQSCGGGIGVTSSSDEFTRGKEIEGSLSV